MKSAIQTLPFMSLARTVLPLRSVSENGGTLPNDWSPSAPRAAPEIGAGPVARLVQSAVVATPAARNATSAHAQGCLTRETLGSVLIVAIRLRTSGGNRAKSHFKIVV